MIGPLLRRWLTSESKPSFRPTTASAKEYKPRLEMLEDRVVPAWTVNTLATIAPSALIQNLIGSGTDHISNISYTGAPGAAGTFTDTQSVVGFGAGIILSSGSAAAVAGPNNNASSTVSNGTPSDVDLDAMIAPTPGFDASVLQFDYRPTGNFVSFTFVFGSEEYPTFAPPVSSGFADVFGFFVNGTNAALIPGTNTAVSINSVNPVTNSQYYVDNFTNPGGPIYGTHNTQMNAYTTVLSVSLPVIPGALNHIKLAVENASDELYDSWVLIKTGSLKSFLVPSYAPMRFNYSPSTGGFSGSYTVANGNNFSYQGPIYLIFVTLPPGVNVTNATGTTPSGHKYFTMGNSLTPYSSLHVNVNLTNPFHLNLGTYFTHGSLIVSSILF